MDDIEEVRRRNLLLLIEKHGGQRRFCDAAKIKNPAQVSQWVNRSPHAGTGKPRVMSSASARRIEIALAMPSNWLDAPRATGHGPRERDVVGSRLSPEDLATSLLALATPRSHKVLLTIIEAAQAGRITDDDIELLGTIAKRFQKK